MDPCVRLGYAYRAEVVRILYAMRPAALPAASDTGGAGVGPTATALATEAAVSSAQREQSLQQLREAAGRLEEQLRAAERAGRDRQAAAEASASAAAALAGKLEAAQLVEKAHTLLAKEVAGGACAVGCAEFTSRVWHDPTRTSSSEPGAS